MSLFAGTQMVNHSQSQTLKHVMGMQTAHFIDGVMVTLLLVKVSTNALIQRVSYFFYKINLITEYQDNKP